MIERDLLDENLAHSRVPIEHREACARLIEAFGSDLEAFGASVPDDVDIARWLAEFMLGWSLGILVQLGCNEDSILSRVRYDLKNAVKARTAKKAH